MLLLYAMKNEFNVSSSVYTIKWNNLGTNLSATLKESTADYGQSRVGQTLAPKFKNAEITTQSTWLQKSTLYPIKMN